MKHTGSMNVSTRQIWHLRFKEYHRRGGGKPEERENCCETLSPGNEGKLHE